MPELTLALLKRGLLLFWGVWLSLVTLTNLGAGLKELGILSADWPLASAHYKEVVVSLAKFQPPPWIPGLLFAGVVVLEALSAALFFRAAWLFPGPNARAARLLAFAAGLALWMSFLLTEEVLGFHPGGPDHWRPFLAQLLTFLVIELVQEPDVAP